MFNLSCVNSKRIHPKNTSHTRNETGGGNVDGVVLVDGFGSNLACLLYDEGEGVVSNKDICLFSRGGKNIGDVTRHRVVRHVGTEASVDAEEEDGVHAERCDHLGVRGVTPALGLEPGVNAAVRLLQKTRQRGTLGHRGGPIRLVKGVLQQRLLGSTELP